MSGIYNWASMNSVLFFEIEHEHRTQKHVSDPMNNSAAKRINMYLRWMVRRDNKGVDLGIWKNISPAQLSVLWICIRAM
jgi:hypothetical protein